MQIPANLYVKRVKTAQRTALIRLNKLLGGNYWRITIERIYSMCSE